MACSAENSSTLVGNSSPDFRAAFNYSAPCETESERIASNVTDDNRSPVCVKHPLDATTMAFLAIYLTIFIFGMIGNGLVIVVILKYQHLKTVTNLYILNLSIADTLFLLVLPLTITVGITEHWIFGSVMCKLFFTLDCVNKFMSAFTVTVMAGDRYLAACHPINSLTYRKSKYAAILLGCIWILALIAMFPAIYYSGLVSKCSGTYSCLLIWPEGNGTYSNIFTTYFLTLAFVIPVICICTFYSMIIARLRRGGSGSLPHHRHCQFRKATRIVTLVICVFIGCWLPYWCMQLIILFTFSPMAFRFYQVFTALSYANSMLNPLLYGFTNEYFREAFNSVFWCRTTDMAAVTPQAGGCGRSEKAYLCLKTPKCIHGESTNQSNLEIEEKCI